MGNLAFVWPYFLIMQINGSLHTPHALSALITGGKQLQLHNLAFLLCHGLSFLLKNKLIRNKDGWLSYWKKCSILNPGSNERNNAILICIRTNMIHGIDWNGCCEVVKGSKDSFIFYRGRPSSFDTFLQSLTGIICGARLLRFWCCRGYKSNPGRRW